MEKLFVYGTLMRGLAGFNELGLDQLTIYRSKAMMNGKLYDLGDFPAAIHDGTDSGLVFGELFDVRSSTVFEKLDEFEGMDGNNVEKSLFVRERVKVHTADGQISFAWAYLYNKPLGNAVLIESGDYEKHVSDKHRPGITTPA